MSALPRVLGLPWSWIAAARVALYRHGPLTRHHLPRPTVSIGALEMGGTGKSPATAAVASRLQRRGWSPAVVSRGYGRSSRGPLLVSDGERIRCGPREAGDEPALYARTLPGVPVAVAARRERAGALLLSNVDADVFILDDAFQHVRVHRDVDLLVVDSDRPFWEGAPPPGGRLREGPAAAGRADAFLLVGNHRDPVRQQLGRRFPDRPIFDLAVEEPGGVPLHHDGPVSPAPPPEPVLPFAGIARPGRLHRSLERAGLRTLPLIEFPDHHWYTEAEVDGLQERARKVGAASLVTTEKDAVRLTGRELDPPIWVWRYRLRAPEGLASFVEARLPGEEAR